MNRIHVIVLAASLIAAALTPAAGLAQSGQREPPQGALVSDSAQANLVDGGQQDDARKELFEKFAKTLSGAKLVGHFTVRGDENQKLTAEEYHIHEVRKMDEGDYWMFKARIKYGGRDVTVPMPLEVRWAGNTPVITLDEVEIPLLGKFSARVVVDGNRYAGTWSHGDVGGHLFGEVLADQAEPDQPEQSPKK